MRPSPQNAMFASHMRQPYNWMEYDAARRPIVQYNVRGMCTGSRQNKGLPTHKVLAGQEMFCVVQFTPLPNGSTNGAALHAGRTTACITN